MAVSTENRILRFWKKTCGLYLFLLFFALLCFSASVFAEDLLQKGIREYRAESYEEALETLKKARELNPKSSVAAFYLGLTYKQIGNYKESAKNFRDALTLTPSVNEAYPELIEMLYNLDELKEAKQWISEAEKAKALPANIAFLKGLVLAKENNNEEAVASFIKAKGLNPALTQAVDFQIAMIYAKERKLKEARNTLKALISIDPSSELASFAKEYETAIARAIEAHKNWRFGIGATYLYDDNVVSKPTAIIGTAAVDNISGKRDSAITNTFRVDYSPLLSGSWSFMAQYSILTTNYFRSYKYDVMAHSIAIIPAYNFQNAALSLPVSYSHMWLNEREYMHLTSVKPVLSIQVFPGHIGQFSLGYSKREMLKYSIGADPDEDRDGNLYSAMIGYVYPFKEGKGAINIRYEYTKDDTQGRNWDSKSDKIGASILYPVINRVNLSLSGDMTFQNYKNIHTVSGTGTNGYPNIPTKRKDIIYNAGASIIYEILKGLNLNLNYSHTRADSNFAIYDYKRNAYNLGITYEF
jgi:tetratricopeptide (TPR) repeat protein